MHPPCNELAPEDRADVLRVRPQGALCTSVHGCTPVNPERQGRDATLSARTRSLPAGHPSDMQARGTTAHGLMMAVLSYGARLQAATGERTWRSPLNGPGGSADSARYRSPWVGASARGPTRGPSARAAVG